MYSHSVVIDNKKIADSFFLLSIKNDEMASRTKAGQFYMLSPYSIDQENHTDFFLKRPISVFDLNENEGIIQFFYQVIGKGTKNLTFLKKGDILSLLGPLGNGFRTDLKNEKILLVGAGVGIAPFQYLQKVLDPSNEIYIVFGGRNHSAVAIAEHFTFKDHSRFFLATDDGSFGSHKNTIELMEQVLDEFSHEDMNKCRFSNFTYVFGCGSTIVLKKISEIAKRLGIECQLSLEKRMACGVKACGACSIKTKNGMERVCSDGPVFNLKNLIIEEL